MVLAPIYQQVKKKDFTTASHSLPPLFGREFDVVLHPDVDHVAGRADEAAAAAGERRHRHALRERDALALRRHSLLRHLLKYRAKVYEYVIGMKIHDLPSYIKI